MTLITDNEKWIDEVCKIGQGVECCRYLVCGADGFECAKDTSLKTVIDRQAMAGKMTADADGCEGFVEV